MAKEGEIGELWISGPQVFDGYVDLPELNQERIIPNPFDCAPAYSRVFKTSDIVHMLEDGNLEYICRKDNMCKVRGFRVDLLGVEVVMLSYPGITEACVTYFTDSGGTNILFGYFIVDHDVDHETLRTHLGEHLPYYAIPVGLIQVNDFPRTLSGKVNRSGFVPPKELDDYKKLAIQYF